MIVWNHLGWTGSEWELSRIDIGLSGIEVEVWEHIPFNYYDWKKKAMLPALIGSTDTHDGTFSNPERTIVYSADLKVESIVDAITITQLLFLPRMEVIISTVKMQ